MLDSSFVWIPAIAVAVCLGLRGVHRGLGFVRTLASMLLVTYVAALLAVALFPVPVDATWLAELRLRGGSRVNVVPLATICAALHRGPAFFGRQVLGNTVMLVPLGALVAHHCRRCKTTRKVALLAAASVGVEVAQGIACGLVRYTYRSVDIDDVILNATGVLLGLYLYRAVSRLRHPESQV